LRLRGLLHSFPLLLGCLLIHLLLLLGRATGLARVFLDSRSASLSRHCASTTQGDQQEHESSNSSHNLSQPKIFCDLTRRII
jgi:hypothetical protein